MNVYDDGPAHITPAASHAYLAERRGVPPAEVRVPPLLLGTFQRAIFARLCEATEAGPDPSGPFRDRTDAVARGQVADQDVTITRFPIGAPAAAMWMEELIASGARRFLFAGAAGSLQLALPIGALALITSAIREDGTSYHYLPPDRVPHPSSTLMQRLRDAAAARGQALAEGPVWTIDAVYRETSAKVARYAAQGAVAVEMEAAALFAVAEVRGVEAALIVVMSDELFHPWIPGFHADALREGMRAAVEIVLHAATSLP